jgi:hypothetical protein
MSNLVNPYRFGGGLGADTITIAASATTSTTGQTSHTINRPTTVVGQVEIAVIATDGGYVDPTIGGGTRTLTPPGGGGWTPFTDQNNGSIRHGVSIYWRIASGTGGGTEVWATSAATALSAALIALEGADASYFLDNFYSVSAISGTTLTAPSIYGSYIRTHQLRIFTGEGSSLTDTPGLLESPVSVSATEKILLGLITPASNGGGQCGTYAVTMGSSLDWTAHTILLKPQNGGGDHASVLYRSEAGFTESGAANVAGTEATFAAQGNLYFKTHLVVTAAFTATALSLKGLSGATQVFTFQHTSAQDYLGPNGNAAGYWIRTNQLNQVAVEETLIMEVQLNAAAASPCRGFIRETLQTNDQPGIAYTVNSTNTTNAGATTFDKLVFYNLSNGGTTTYSRVLLTSEPIFTP